MDRLTFDDDLGLSWERAIRAKRDLLRDKAWELRREAIVTPNMRAEIEQRYARDLERLDAVIEQHKQAAHAEQSWRENYRQDDLATDLALTALAARDQDDFMSFFRSLSRRFQDAANPPVDEPDYSNEVPDLLDGHNPMNWTPRTGPNREELRRQVEVANEPAPTHDDPLNMRYDAEQKRRQQSQQPARERPSMLPDQSPPEPEWGPTERERKHFSQIFRRRAP